MRQRKASGGLASHCGVVGTAIVLGLAAGQASAAVLKCTYSNAEVDYFKIEAPAKFEYWSPQLSKWTNEGNCNDSGSTSGGGLARLSCQIQDTYYSSEVLIGLPGGGYSKTDVMINRATGHIDRVDSNDHGFGARSGDCKLSDDPALGVGKPVV